MKPNKTSITKFKHSNDRKPMYKVFNKADENSQCGIMQLVGFCAVFTFQKLRLPSDSPLTNCLPSWCHETDLRPTPWQIQPVLQCLANQLTTNNKQRYSAGKIMLAPVGVWKPQVN